MAAGSKRTPLLIAAVVALAAANVWWFTRDKAGAEPDFVLGAQSESIAVNGAEIATLPVFDPQRGGWSVQGKPAGSLRARLRKDGVADPYILAVMPAQANARDFRAMLLSLTDQNICAFAIAQEGEVKAAVQHIVSVRDNGGSLKVCKQG